MAKQQIGAFVLDEDLTYWWTCYAYTPDGRGSAAKVKYQAEFEHLSLSDREEMSKEYRDRMEEIREAREAGEDVEELSKELGTFQHVMLRKVTRRLRGMKDAKGNDLAFDSDDPLFEVFLDYPWGRNSLWEGFTRSQQSRAPEKN